MSKKRSEVHLRPSDVPKRKRMDYRSSVSVRNTSTETFSADFTNDFRQWRDEGLFTDGVLRTMDGGVFNIHRALVCSHSPVLMAMFYNTLKQEELSDVTLSLTSSDVMKVILDFIYGQEIVISEGTVLDLLLTADLFQINDLVSTCVTFMLSRLRMETMLPILRASETLYNPLLTRDVLSFILRYFPQMLENRKEYRSLNVEHMGRFLRNDFLNVQSEEATWDIILDWVKHRSSRNVHLPSLLSAVRFGLLPSKRVPSTRSAPNLLRLRLTEQVSHHFRQVADVCPSLVSFDETRFPVRLEDESGPSHEISGLLRIDNSSSMASITMALDNLDLDNLRRPRIPPSVILAVGGWSTGSAITLIETYDVRADRWYTLPEGDIYPSAYHSVEVLDDLMYVVGGCNIQYLSSVRCLDPITREWTEKSHMKVSRCYVSTAVANGQLYAMGGFDGNKRLKTCERFHPATNQWEDIASMTKIRSDADAVVFENEVYVVGGFDGQQVLRSMEAYNPVKDSWCQRGSMTSLRSGLSIVVLWEYLYALGGFDGHNRLRTVERYHPASDFWDFVADMNIPRSNFGAVVMDNQIYVMGGYDGEGTTNLCERYDPEDNTWTLFGEMNVKRSALSSCVLKDLPNRRDYTTIGLNPNWNNS